MSFGRPGGFGDTFKVSPPQRGSFPLDHEGECKKVMMDHLRCLTDNKGDNGKCRLEARKYLECRMDHGLMERDDMSNLGLGNVNPKTSASSPPTSNPTPNKPKPPDPFPERI